MTLEPGSTLLHFRLVERIGEGGMGVVWKAVDTTLDREVAIKLLPGEFSEDAERVARFRREAKVLASLNHPHIAAIYGLHEAEASSFLSMELVPGEDLAQRLRSGPLPVAEALTVAAQVAEALEATHEAGVIHRDLKPANVSITPAGRVKVLDFGLAKPEAAPFTAEADVSSAPTVSTGPTGAGRILGTIAYMSPEQARGQSVDRRTDIWAFGCLVYEALTGRPAFTGETASDKLAAVLKEDPDWGALPNEIPAGVGELLRRCLTKDPGGRPATMTEVREALETVRSGAASASGSVPSPEIALGKSIAVLPFANMSSDPEQEYFCDGIAEELINGLGRLEDLRVAARTSSFQFKGSGFDLREVGERLAVEAILEGSVRKEALDHLEAAVDVGYRQRAWLETDSELESLRDHPRYRALLDRL